MSDKNVHVLLYAVEPNDEYTLVKAAIRLGHVDYEVLHEDDTVEQVVLGDVLRRLATGDADTLIVTHVSRLARSTRDFLYLVEQSKRYGWKLEALDLGLDVHSYQGRFMGTVLSAIAEMNYSATKEN